MQGIFDSHAHYDDEKFDDDREQTLQRVFSSGVEYIINIGCDIASSHRSIELAASHDKMYCAVGIHPHEAAQAPQDWEDEIRRLAKQPKVVAIGEIGLDYHYDFSPRDLQRIFFEKQLIMANELDIPVIIHSREATSDTMELLRKYKPRGVVHCFSGSAETAAEVISLGMYIGFTGIVTFPNAKKPISAAAVVPPDKILIETDCPYMSPVPYRGQRCDSSMIPETAAALAKIAGVSPDEIYRRTSENAKRLFGII